MKISSSTIIMTGASKQRTVSRVSETLTAWVGSRQNAQTQVNGEGDSDFKQLLEKLKDAVSYDPMSQTANVRQYEEELITLSKEDENKILMLNRLIEAITGKKIKFVIPKKLLLKQDNLQIPAQNRQFGLQTMNRQVLQGWGLDYQRQEFYSEEEAMSFQSTGNVTTSDGKTLEFSLNLNLSRSFLQQSNLQIKAGDALIDPLVINYGQPSSTLSSNKYSFDLNMDGKNEQISFANSGSGFLVFDKNGDGKINDGSELFGPKTGNGFLELARFDTDGNNWIDENDEIYSKLQIWTKNERGEDQLFAIGCKGIGAIYLGSADTLFSLKDNSNSTLGQIRQTGIFLREDGTAGTIQHIDISL